MAPLRILLIDNYDSYTFNLYQGIAEVSGGCFPEVVRNDQLTWTELEAHLGAGAYDAIVISPGPGTPAHAGDLGVCRDLLRARPRIPVLGVCLGMQALALEFGGDVRRALCGPRHGSLSPVKHDGDALFAGIPSGAAWPVVRYHSLEVPEASLPACLLPIARVDLPGDQTLMAIRHADLPYYGVQFHPESICTAFGPALLFNFLSCAARFLGKVALEPPVNVPLAGPPGKPPALLHGSGASTSLAPIRLGVVRSEAVDMTSVIARSDLHQAATHIFERLFHGRAGGWWLDSSLQERGGRWSFMGAAGSSSPALGRQAFYEGGGALRLHRGPEAPPERLDLGAQTFWDWLEEDLRQYAVIEDSRAALPFDFCGGWVGYLGYELRLEGRTGNEPPARAPRVDLDAAPPHASLVWTDRFLALDGHTGQLLAVGLYDVGDGKSESGARSDAEAWARQALEEALEAARAGPLPAEASKVADKKISSTAPADPAAAAGLVPREEHSRYLSNIRACVEAMVEGESYELCLTTQLSRKGAPPAWPLYKQLRCNNPAPYAAWLDFAALRGPQVACSSPELFLRCDREGLLEAKPIKGTAPRVPGDPEADERSARELQANEKERAENLMIVDLLRNDLGRVCAPGSVHVPTLMGLESFATVHQLVSTVRGARAKDASTVDCLRAAFPGGSMTGAPKLRSMAILENLEGGPRGVYSGGIGFLSPNGAFCLNIVIRTAVVHADAISIGAGGAITVLSEPEAEWDEMNLKAAALLRTICAVDQETQ